MEKPQVVRWSNFPRKLKGTFLTFCHLTKDWWIWSHFQMSVYNLFRRYLTSLIKCSIIFKSKKRQNLFMFFICRGVVCEMQFKNCSSVHYLDQISLGKNSLANYDTFNEKISVICVCRTHYKPKSCKNSSWKYTDYKYIGQKSKKKTITVSL